MARELWLLRVLTVLDLMPFAAYCEAYALWRRAEEAIAMRAELDPVFHGLLVKGPDGFAEENPLVGIARGAARDMVRFAGEFGLSPAARNRISVGAPGFGPPPGPSKFAGLLGPRDEFDGLLGR